ncbi:unnamed protein product [Caretta caretta]
MLILFIRAAQQSLSETAGDWRGRIIAQGDNAVVQEQRAADHINLALSSSAGERGHGDSLLSLCNSRAGFCPFLPSAPGTWWTLPSSSPFGGQGWKASRACLICPVPCDFTSPIGALQERHEN